ncbi:MAG: hypothetical protein F4246_10205 [Rhodothermaceae bacterium]|nr:hypothetical protein [Rhodothermaceae bacterium]MYD57373.1 hypothetical protein [Rhodothermaceae bacterium]MYJ57327.1 hypothetical protein [Rhodothermaceae bacterium]
MEAAGCLLVIILIPVVFGILCAAIAENKGRDGIGWFFIGFFLTVIGLVIALIVKPDHVELNKRKVADGGFNKCKYCLEII